MGLFIALVHNAITDKTWDKIIIYRALIYKSAPNLHQLRFQLKQHGHNLYYSREYNIHKYII